MTYPIPNEAFDDRLAVVGTAGSGKTYLSSTAVERVMAAGHRVIVVDPLGVWYGLRLKPDGETPSPYKPVIFGGKHGDIGLTEQAGALIGETVAGMSESCIVDLSQVGTKSAEKRFMLSFLTALYRHTENNPVHVVFDEADMWAPQVLLDKEGEAAKLLGMMETLVRRGRVKGFIPWLITQRPAVLSKNVLSQVDGIVALKLTSSQDRDAIAAWVEGQADRAQWKEMYASLATMQRGQGIVWIPGRGILKTAEFPAKTTYDSSRTPKRGELLATASLKPIDIGALRDRLAKVETEAKSNDPKALKAEISALKRELASKPVEKINTPDPEVMSVIEERAYAQGHRDGYKDGLPVGKALGNNEARESLAREIYALATRVREGMVTVANPEQNPQKTFVSTGLPKAPSRVNTITKIGISGYSDLSLNGAANKMLAVIDTNPPVRRSWQQVATLAGLRARGGHFNTGKKSLIESGLIEESNGLVAIISPSGQAASPSTDPADVVKLWESNLSGAAPKILRTLFDQGAATREEIAERLGMQPRGGHWNTAWKELRDNDIVRFEDKMAVLTELFQ